MKRSLIFTLFIGSITSITLSFAGGDVAGNGGGIAEQNLAFAYTNLDRFLDICLHSNICELNKEETALTENIRAALKSEKTHEHQLIFDSEKKHPGTFLIDGLIRLAKTGDAIGSPIFINTDLLYIKDDSGEVKALDLPTAAAILTHELGHHQGTREHQLLDLLGSKVRRMLKQHTQTINIGKLEASLVQYELNDLDQLIVSDGDVMTDLSEKVHAIAKCPFKDSNLVALQLWNLHWNPSHFRESEGYTIVPLQADLTMKCSLSQGTTVAAGYEVLIELRLTNEANPKLHDISLSLDKSRVIGLSFEIEVGDKKDPGQIVLPDGSPLSLSFSGGKLLTKLQKSSESNAVLLTTTLYVESNGQEIELVRQTNTVSWDGTQELTGLTPDGKIVRARLTPFLP